MNNIKNLEGIKLTGITVRTNNKNELTPEKAKIGKLCQQYQEENITSKILHRVKPGKTFLAYTNYESDHTGEYTFFIGEEVSSLEAQSLEVLEIEAGLFKKIDTECGKIPEIVINAWQKIWQMTDADFGKPRKYQTDFEVHDYTDPTNAVVEIYLGLRDS